MEITHFIPHVIIIETHSGVELAIGVDGLREEVNGPHVVAHTTGTSRLSVTMVTPEVRVRHVAVNTGISDAAGVSVYSVHVGGVGAGQAHSWRVGVEDVSSRVKAYTV